MLFDISHSLIQITLTIPCLYFLPAELDDMYESDLEESNRTVPVIEKNETVKNALQNNALESNTF